MEFIVKSHKDINFYTWSEKSRLSEFLGVFSWEKLRGIGD